MNLTYKVSNDTRPSPTDVESVSLRFSYHRDWLPSLAVIRLLSLHEDSGDALRRYAIRN